MSSEFISYLHEVFASFGTIQTKRMFGGFGIYHQGLMFGLVIDDTLYLKADNDSKLMFEKLGLQPFQFNRQGKIVTLSYYQAPEEIFEDFEKATIWARQAYDISMKSKNYHKKSL